MLSNLGGGVFESEYPDQFSRLIRAQAEAAIGGNPLTSEQKAMLARRKELCEI
jgi:hypothetical protein